MMGDDVEVDVEAFLVGLVDDLKCGLHRRLGHDLVFGRGHHETVPQVGDLDGYLGLPAYVDGLKHAVDRVDIRLLRLLVSPRLAPEAVAVVDAPIPCGDLGTGEDLFEAGPPPWLVCAAHAEAPASVLHRLLDEPPHLRDLPLLGVALVVVSHHVAAYVAVAYEGNHVWREAGLLHLLEVASHGVPVHLPAVELLVHNVEVVPGDEPVTPPHGGPHVLIDVYVEPRLPDELVVGASAVAAVATHEAGYPLADEAVSLRIVEDAEVYVVVDVDESGRDYQTFCVEHTSEVALQPLFLADGGYPLPVHREVPLILGIACAIDD